MNRTAVLQSYYTRFTTSTGKFLKLTAEGSSTISIPHVHLGCVLCSVSGGGEEVHPWCAKFLKDVRAGDIPV